MKLSMLVFTVFSFGLTRAAFAADNYSDLAAQGYRWINVDGLRAGISQEGVLRHTGHRTDTEEVELAESVRAYYLIPGTLARVIQNDPGKGMSQIRLAGITRDLWTHTKYLSSRPITDPYGIVETPENAGIILTGTTERIDLPQYPDVKRDLDSIRSELPTSGPSPAPSINPVSSTEFRTMRIEMNQQK
jgi:hypothetical protein